MRILLFCLLLLPQIAWASATPRPTPTRAADAIPVYCRGQKLIDAHAALKDCFAEHRCEFQQDPNGGNPVGLWMRPTPKPQERKEIEALLCADDAAEEAAVKANIAAKCAADATSIDCVQGKMLLRMLEREKQ